MKNVIVALLFVISSVSFASADCTSGTCSRSSRPVLTTTRNVVTAPARVVRRVVTLPSRVRASRCR